MSTRNVANINSPSLTLGGVAATALSGIGTSQFLLITNPGTVGAYVETGGSTVTSSSTKGYVAAGTTQVFTRNSGDTHIISTQSGLVVQATSGV